TLSTENKNFFFSSRRRHTRSTRDWSSDVCSSDLRDKPRQGVVANTLKLFRNGAACRVSSFTLVGFIDWLDEAGRTTDEAAALGRSEERRVGKEWRWSGGGGQG